MAKKSNDIEKIIEEELDVKKTYSPSIGTFDILRSKGQFKRIFRGRQKQIFEQCQPVMIAVQTIAKAVTYAGFHFRPIAGREVSTFDIELMNRFVEEVNSEDCLDDLIYDTALNLLVFGNAYWEVRVNKRLLDEFYKVIEDKNVDPYEIKIPIELYSIHPETIVIDVSETGEILGYIQETPSGEITFSREEVIHFKTPTPVDQLYGKPPIDFLNDTIASYIFAQEYNGKFFDNNATPRLHIDLGNVSPAKVREFINVIERELKGQAHRNLVTSGGVKITPISLTNHDMEFTEFMKFLRQTILASYGVMPAVAGIIERVSDIEGQIALFKSLAVRPTQKIIANRINKKLMPLFKGIKLRFDFNPIDNLDLKQKSDIEEKDLRNLVRTINEIRADRGLSSVPWGDTPIIPYADLDKARLKRGKKRVEEENIEEEEKEEE